MRDRLLIRHFLWRLLEHDLVSPHADRRSTLSAAGGTLVTVSLFLAVLTAAPYQFDNFMPPGITSMRSLDERFLFTSASMLVAALAATAQWGALVLEPRDAAILGALPVPRSMIVRAKFAATALFALAVIVAWNLPPTLARVATLPIGLRIGWAGTLQLTLAHAVATGAAGAFGFLAVLGFRETVCALVGPARFRRISAALQALLIVLLTTALLLLPSSYSNVGRRWLAADSVKEKLLAPLWFVGLNETLSGRVIDSLPRTRPERFLMVPEELATAMYRRLSPVYERQALTALSALSIAGLVTLLAARWNSRRLPMAEGDQVARNGIVRATFRWIAIRVLSGPALQQAGFFFALQTLSRRVTHRVALAGALAVGFALVVVVAGSVQPSPGKASAVPVSMLAAQYLLLGCAISGFRHATRLPSELRAGTTFSLAWSGRSAPYIDGIKGAAWLIVLPTLTLVAIWHVAILGWYLAALQFSVGVAFSFLVVQAQFFHNRRLPLVSAYVPSEDAKVKFIMQGGALLLAAFALAWIERLCLDALVLYGSLNAVLLLIGAGVAIVDRLTLTAPVVLDLDEAPSLPTQRFSLV